MTLWRGRSSPAAHTEDSDLQAQSGGTGLSTVDHARELIRKHLPLTDSSRNRAITIDDVAVGEVGLSAIERTHGTAWAYSWLASKARGHGFAARASGTVADEAFKDGPLRLEPGHRVDDPASCAVAIRAGLVTEGLERQKLRYGAERFGVETHARRRTDPAPNLEALPTTR